ncbi:MAG: hypothetical protein ACFCU4_09540 [Puniceicoccaceae bacterium]
MRQTNISNLILFLLLCIGSLNSACVSIADLPPDVRGTFVSNREATIEKWRREEPFGHETEKMIEVLGGTLGRTTAVLDSNSITLRMGDSEQVDILRRVSLQDGVIHLRYHSNIYGRVLQSRIVPDADGFWVYSDEILVGFSERFDRVRP